MKLKQIFKQYFTFTRGERNGIFILCIILLLLIAANFFIDYLDFKKETDFSEIKRLIAEWENKNSFTEKMEPRFFYFDPNTISERCLDSISIPKNIKRNILKYREKGGRFSTPNDVRRIYGMNDSIFLLIKDYICIEKLNEIKLSEKKIINKHWNEIKNDRQYLAPDIKNNSNKIVELNTADTLTLKSLKGIGSVLALRIIRYRDLLGGFYKTDQLLEVYHFNEDTYNLIRNQIVVDTTCLKKININFSDFKALLRHPYISKETAEAIITYRDTNGAFKSCHQLVKNEIVNDQIFLKLRYYLTVD